jgi:hypothetical protein
MKRVIALLSLEDTSFKKYLISENEWKQLELIRDFLQPFYEATVMVSQQSYPSSCVVLPLYNAFLNHLNTAKNSDERIIKNCALIMEQKFLNYNNEIKNKLAHFATILDPRLNIKFLFENLELDSFNEIKKSFTDYYFKYYCDKSYETEREVYDIIAKYFL